MCETMEGFHRFIPRNSKELPRKGRLDFAVDGERFYIEVVLGFVKEFLVFKCLHLRISVEKNVFPHHNLITRNVLLY